MEDFSGVEENYLFYGGSSGSKRGFTNENGDNYFLKFPQKIRKIDGIKYSTSPISEYLGSKIYKELGYDVHEVELGIYDRKVVVACQDFISEGFRFYDIATVSNYYLGENEEKRQSLKLNNKNNYNVNLEELVYLFKKNKVLSLTNGIEERFWDMFVIDSFISNNDRHNKNWGLLINKNTKEIKLAPIFDNSNSFFSQYDIEPEKILSDIEILNSYIFKGDTPFLYLNHSVDSVKTIKNLSIGKEKNKFTQYVSKQVRDSIERIVPKIELNKINKIIDDIPNEFHGVKVLSDNFKNFYKIILKERYHKVLLLNEAIKN